MALEPKKEKNEDVCHRILGSTLSQYIGKRVILFGEITSVITLDTVWVEIETVDDVLIDVYLTDKYKTQDFPFGIFEIKGLVLENGFIKCEQVNEFPDHSPYRFDSVEYTSAVELMNTLNNPWKRYRT